MIFDLFVSFILIGAFINGYKNGLLKTILRTAFFIAGGVAAAHFMIESNQSGWLIVAILAGAYGAAWVGTLLSKMLKVTLIRGPLRWADSLLGAILELGKYVVLLYLIGTILLWAPWSTGQNAVSESKFYLQVDKRAPELITNLRAEVEKVLSNPRL
jgi:uncharacterized membrane protein required for colicin V production